MKMLLLLAVPTCAFHSPALSGGRPAVRGASCGVLMAADEQPEKKKGIDLSGLMQVVSMGAGAPMLGDLKKTNFKKP